MGVIDQPMPGEDRLDLPRALRLADGRPLLAPPRPGRRPHPVRRQPRHRSQPGARSSLRHWHRAEDEFVMVTEGELVLVQDEGEYVMRPGDCAAWKAGDTQRPLLPQPHRPRGPLPRRRRQGRRTRSPPTPTSTSCFESRTAPPASPTTTAPPGPARGEPLQYMRCTCVVPTLYVDFPASFQRLASRPPRPADSEA